MKKILAVITAIAVTLAFPVAPVHADTNTGLPITKMPMRVMLKVNSNNIEYDNKTYVLGSVSSVDLPSRTNNDILIPLRPLAEIFGGELAYNGLTRVASLKIDNTLFEFIPFESTAKVNGATVALTSPSRLNEGVFKVPVSIFQNRLPNYSVKIYGTKAFVIVRNGKTDWYDSSGKLIGDKYSGERFKTWTKRLETEVSKDNYNRITAMINGIVSQISRPGMSDYDKVYAANKFVVGHMSYNIARMGAYDYFDTGQGVCIGYAYLTGLLLDKMGIENTLVYGYAGVSGLEDIDLYEACDFSRNEHVWNIVKVDGQYYHLDTTMNDSESLSKSELEQSTYFLLNDNQIQLNHSWRKTLYPACSSFSYANIKRGVIHQPSSMPLSILNSAPPEAPKGIELQESQLKQMFEDLKRCHVGDPALANLNSLASAIAFEGSQPVEKDGNRSVRYTYKASSGITYWCYYKVDSKDYLGYDILLQNVEITENNYAAIFKKINENVSTLVGTKQLACVVTRDNKYETDFVEKDYETLYKEIVNGSAIITSIYKKDNVYYYVGYSGNADDQTVLLSVDVCIRYKK